jgi:hypothetical protein
VIGTSNRSDSRHKGVETACYVVWNQRDRCSVPGDYKVKTVYDMAAAAETINVCLLVVGIRSGEKTSSFYR